MMVAFKCRDIIIGNLDLELLVNDAERAFRIRGPVVLGFSPRRPDSVTTSRLAGVSLGLSDKLRERRSCCSVWFGLRLPGGMAAHDARFVSAQVPRRRNTVCATANSCRQGQACAIARASRRELILTSAPILSSLGWNVPQVASANCVCQPNPAKRSTAAVGFAALLPPGAIGEQV
jgi:hypothetical protein